MAYKLTRSGKINEKLELETGQVIEVNVSIADIIKEYTLNFNNLIKLEKELKTVTIENMEPFCEKMGNVFLRLMNVLFGEKDTEIIVKYYNENYFELINNVTPFIVEVIQPHVREYITLKQSRKNKYIK